MNILFLFFLFHPTRSSSLLYHAHLLMSHNTRLVPVKVSTIGQTGLFVPKIGTRIQERATKKTTKYTPQVAKKSSTFSFLSIISPFLQSKLIYIFRVRLYHNKITCQQLKNASAGKSLSGRRKLFKRCSKWWYQNVHFSLHPRWLSCPSENFSGSRYCWKPCASCVHEVIHRSCTGVSASVRHCNVGLTHPS